MAKSQNKTIIWTGIGLCLASGLVGAIVAESFDVSWGGKLDVDFGQSISIILAALGATLTALALIFGALAIVGWATFSQQVDNNVRTYIEDDFDKKGPLFNAVVNDLKPKLREDLLPDLEKAMFKGAEPTPDELAELDDTDEPEE